MLVPVPPYPRRMVRHPHLNFVAQEGRRGPRKAPVSDGSSFSSHRTCRGFPNPGELLRFDTDINSFYLFDVCELCRAVTSERVPLFRLCTLHFEMSFPQLIDDETAKAQIETALLHLDPRNKFKFLELLPKLERMMMGL